MAVDKQQIKALRWLYADEKAFKKAVRQLVVKDLKDSGDADKLKQFYKAKAKLTTKELRAQAKDLKNFVPKTQLKKLTDWIVLKFEAKHLGYIAGAALVVYLGVAYGPLTGSSSQELTPEISSTSDTAATTGSAAAATAQPTDYLLPATAEVTEENIRFDPDKGVSSFVDSIGGVGVTVSMQSLPSDFLGDPDTNVKDLAEGFAATEKISVGEDVHAYRGVSVLDGIETVIFTKNKLLVFIQSADQLDLDQLSGYIAALN